MSADASSRSCACSRELGSEFHDLHLGRECSRLVSNVRTRRRGIAARCARLHKHRRCCRMHAKARTGGERVQVWIGLGQGESRVNRAACRRDWGCTGWGGMSWS